MKILVRIVAAWLCLFGALPLMAYETLSGPTELIYWNKAKTYTGYTLFGSPTTTYLIDMAGRVVHTWTGYGNPHLLDNGHILDSPGYMNAFYEIDWNNSQVWSYHETRPNYAAHHDFRRIFNKKLNADTTIYIVRKPITNEQALAAGCDPANAPYNDAAADGLTEIDMAGNIIWEWNFFDHGIQDIDPNKPNYVGAGKTIADYPGRINLNLPGQPLQLDWLHANSVDYNDELDQLSISSRLAEFYVIDHGHTFIAGDPSGSMALAASPAGDFLYRFGDPAKYQQGQPPAVLTDTFSSTTGQRQIGGNHQADWIKPGLPGAGNFLVFVNGEFLFEKTPQSYIFEVNPYLSGPNQNSGTYVNPPSAGYYLFSPLDAINSDKQPKLMSNQIAWTYATKDYNGFFSHVGGNAQRLPNGNTLIRSATEGHIFEVTPAREMVWEYILPVSQQHGLVTWLKDNAPSDNIIERAVRYSVTDPALAGHNLAAGPTITGKTPTYYAPPVANSINQPQFPAPNEPVWITVAMANAGNIKQVILIYYLPGGQSPFNVTMIDDGSKHDGTANDGVFGAQIQGVPANTTVSYYILVTDNTGIQTPIPSNAPNSMYYYTAGDTSAAWLSPAAGLTFAGPAGALVNLPSQTYTLNNSGGSILNWSALKNQNWLDVSPISGTLNSGANTNLTVTINSAAANLPTGIYTCAVTLVDATNSVTATRTVSLIARSDNYSISLVSPGDQTADEDSLLTFPLQTTNPNCDTITYSMAGTPTGATLNALTGVFSWHPNYNAAEGGFAGQAGHYALTFTVTTPLSSDSKAISITINNVNNPDQANSPAPANGAADVPATATLFWSSSEFAASFDVYLGTDASGVGRIASGVTETYHTPSTILSYSTTYYWKIDTHNTSGQIVGGDIWSFTTMPLPQPGQAGSPIPANGATDTPTTQFLRWTPASYADSYDVYLATTTVNWTPITNTSSVQYHVSNLQFSTTYYWQVDSRNAAVSTPGTIWNFTTQAQATNLPAKTTNPNPPDGTTNVPVNQMLNWSPADYAESYDVYIGAAFTGWTPITNTVLMSYTPNTPLQYSAIYYWRVDARNTIGSTTGDLWSFATQAQPATLPAKVANPIPANNTTSAPITATLTWSAANGADFYEVYFGTTSTGLTPISTTLTAFSPLSLSYGSLYYWRVDSRNSFGRTTGDVWEFTTQSNQTNGGSSGGTESNSKKCGLLGVEALIALGLIRLARMTVKRRP